MHAQIKHSSELAGRVESTYLYCTTHTSQRGFTRIYNAIKPVFVRNNLQVEASHICTDTHLCHKIGHISTRYKSLLNVFFDASMQIDYLYLCVCPRSASTLPVHVVRVSLGQ